MEKKNRRKYLEVSKMKEESKQNFYKKEDPPFRKMFSILFSLSRFLPYVDKNRQEKETNKEKI